MLIIDDTKCEAGFGINYFGKNPILHDPYYVVHDMTIFIWLLY